MQNIECIYNSARSDNVMIWWYAKRRMQQKFCFVYFLPYFDVSVYIEAMVNIFRLLSNNTLKCTSGLFAHNL